MTTANKDAKALAHYAHRGQLRNGKHYTHYLQKVVSVLSDFGYTGRWEEAGWLCTTLSMTAVTHIEVRRRFGDWVAAIVDAVTVMGDTGRQENYNVYTAVQHFPDAAVLGVAMRIARIEQEQKDSLDMDVCLRDKDEFFCHVGHKVKLSMQQRLKNAYNKSPMKDGLT